MTETYQEIFPNQENLSHLAETVERYLTANTPLWFIEKIPQGEPLPMAIACLWMGTAIDQISGDRYAHIFLIYVAPEHRQQGLAKTLIRQAEIWAKARGDRQIGLQVFLKNQTALNLYQSLGFHPQSWLMTKSLIPEVNHWPLGQD